MTAEAPGGAIIRGDIVFEAEGRNDGGFRNEVTVHLRGPNARSFELPTDEGPLHGGGGTAPYPLAYFTSALTACVMTQLRAFARRLRIELRGLSVDTRCHWERVQRGGEPYLGAPVAFTLDVALDTDAPELEQRRLLAAAVKGCFIEQSLKPGVVRHRLKTSAGFVEVRLPD